MANYDTTGTCQEDTFLSQGAANSVKDGLGRLDVESAAVNINVRTILNFILPQKPAGADRINRTMLVLTRKQNGYARTLNIYRLGQTWSAASATWNWYNGSGNIWA